jgi:TetR/AcrR family transcriptional repressor of mexJK operon
MSSTRESRSALKRRAILEAATRAFLSKGYDSTSMDDVASLAKVSKPSVYRFFLDKERLFAEIISSTTDQVHIAMRDTLETLTASKDVEADLNRLASRFLKVLMQPQVLRLRRLVIANAERFPAVCRTWYEEGFERMLGTLAGCFKELADRKLLRVGDPFIAAQHFVGLLLWIPINRAMFTGDVHASDAIKLDAYAMTAVRAFLSAYSR